jgi:hypothetical protein
MILKIKSIDAEILDVSTVSENVFIVNKWIIRYHIDFINDHTVDGQFSWIGNPHMPDIMRYIRKCYENTRFTKRTGTEEG